MSNARAAHAHSTFTPCLLLLAGLTFVLALQVAVAMAPLAQKDERAHAAYAITLADGRLPTIDTPIPDDPAHYPALTEVQAGEDAAHRSIWTANHPPLYYLMSVPLVWFGDAIGHPGATLFGMRALNGLGIALSVLLVGLIARELVPRRPMVPVLAAGFATSCGAVGYVGGAIYNDGLATAAAFLALLMALRIVRRGVDRRLLAVLVAASVAAAALRSSGLVAVAVAALAVLGSVLVRDRSRSAQWRAVCLAAVVGAVPALAIGWFYVRNIRLYGDATASAALFAKFGRIPDGSALSQLMSGGFYRHLVGSLWTDGDVGNIWGIAGALLMAATAAGLLLEAWRRQARRTSPVVDEDRGDGERRLTTLCWSLVGVYTAIEVASVASFIAGGGWFHARYALPLLPLLGTLVALALLRLGRLVPQVRRTAGAGARDLVVALPVALAFVAVAVVCHVDTERHVDGVAHNATRAGLLVLGDLAVLAVAVSTVGALRRRLTPAGATHASGAAPVSMGARRAADG